MINVSTWVHPWFFLGARYSSFSFLVLTYYVPNFLVPCCDVRQDFRIKTMFDSLLPPVVYRIAQFLFTFFAYAQWCLTHIVLCCFCFVYPVNHMLPVPLVCPFLIAPLVFPNVYSTVTEPWQFRNAFRICFSDFDFNTWHPVSNRYLVTYTITSTNKLSYSLHRIYNNQEKNIWYCIYAVIRDF